MCGSIFSEGLLQWRNRQSEGGGIRGRKEDRLPIPLANTWTDVDLPDPRCFEVEHPEMYLKLEPTTNPD
jgi:hypothetical protein